MIRTINGLEDYQSGSIYFQGDKIIPNEKNLQKLRQKSGWYFKVTICFLI
ncbi:hypothetical protein NBRC111893_509 [Lentilactobacillus kosonis]|uniref:Uncharacterized protein n=1 Tax=Lentilactobacillus kosonis TaxID=2810561 RepID=A0A401FJ16_9LACO|nr:hypothetical protein NBRC111893_509 [Lentilactobacillus kosonis]